MGQAHGGNRMVDARAPFGGGKFWLAGEVQAEGDVLLQAQPGQQARVLEGHRQAGVRALQRLAVQGHAATAGLLQAGQYPQQAGLADPAGAEDGHHFAGCQLQVELRQHCLPATLARVAQADVAGFEQHLAHAAPAWRCSSARSCTRLGVTIGTKADSRQRRAKPSPYSLR
ncbi:hypothetical protein D3C76_854830 [compost metagenome]